MLKVAGREEVGAGGMSEANREKYSSVERGDGSYDSTSLFLYIRQLL